MVGRVVDPSDAEGNATLCELLTTLIVFNGGSICCCILGDEGEYYFILSSLSLSSLSINS
uniref:Uncharacterized protein n=1 Tax=viral metagenome TaxID=1070528 RepID=A0A6C0BLC0_9ZZZZ